MIGKASDVKITDSLSGPNSVRGWLLEHPQATVVDIKATSDENTDYFYIIYKEYSDPDPFRDPFEVN